MSRIPTLDDVDVAGRPVLVRVDFNVPIHNGRVGDKLRIERAAPTIRELQSRGARIVMVSHLGRPGGEVDASMSLRPVANAVTEVMKGRPVSFSKDCIGPIAADVVNTLENGEITLLENLRFYKGEEANDASFAFALADLADLYVNDAFACVHRAHASIVAITEHLPSVAGRSLQAEIEALDLILARPTRPLAALIGGAKTSSKLAVLENLLDKVDIMIIGGAMANTFIASRGKTIGKSLYEPDLMENARKIIARASTVGCQLVLPEDALVANSLAKGTPHRISDINEINATDMILDIGPRTVETIARLLEHVSTVIWNGPLGAFEIYPFNTGTRAIATAITNLTVSGKLTSVAGGGDTVASLSGSNPAPHFTYLSTAGGAFLEWLEGNALPGIEALKRVDQPS